MKKNIVIIGSSGLAKEIVFLIEENNKRDDEWNILGYIDLDKKGEYIGKYKVIGDDDWLINYEEDIYVVNGIGDPILRSRIVKKISINPHIKFPNMVSCHAIISDSIKMGMGNIVCAGSIMTADIELGDFCFINLDCTIGHDVKMGNYTTINPSTNISGNVVVNSYTEIGTGTHVIQGIEIGEHVMIGAGTVVIRNIASNCKVVGNPARVI